MTETATTAEFLVAGMTCGHCVAAVTEEVAALDGVTDVAIALGDVGPSTLRITAAPQPARELVSAAVDEAGYQLLP